MKVQDPLTSYQAFWIASLSAGAGIVGTLIALGEVPALFRALWTEEAAGWAAAIATVGAVIVALRASKEQVDAADRAQSHTKELQDRAWIREDGKAKAATARLANAFSRDLVFAARELNLVIANLHPSVFVKPSGPKIEYMLRDKATDGLEMIERFIGQLDGFDDQDVVALNAALIGWKQLMSPSKVPRDDVSDQRAAKIAANMRKHAIALHGQFSELNERMIGYFQHFTFLKGEVVDEIPDELKTAMREGTSTPAGDDSPQTS